MRIHAVKDYIKWLLNEVQAITNQTGKIYFYKIVDKITCKKTGEEKFVVQIAGKNVFLQLTPQQLMYDDLMLRGFSPLDIRTITYTACQQEKIQPIKKPFFKVIAQFFSTDRHREMFTLKTEGTTTEINQSAQEISNDPALIKQLGAEDAHRVGYVAGVEQVVVEQEILEKRRTEASR
jgi:hypothetical protein